MILSDGVRLGKIWDELEVEEHHDFGGELGTQWELCWGWYEIWIQLEEKNAGTSGFPMEVVLS